MDFIILVILFSICFAFHKLSGGALLVVFILSWFFIQFGPNTTTFIVPGKCFPTRYKLTSYGISVATGKIGAIISQTVFGPLKPRATLRRAAQRRGPIT